MTGTIYIDETFGEIRTAFCDGNDGLRDLLYHRSEDPDPTGDVHMARVTRKASDGLFLELTAGQQAFLKARNAKDYPEGQLLPVQIRAAGQGGKLPIATTTITHSIGDISAVTTPRLLHHDDNPWLTAVTTANADHIITNSHTVMGLLRGRHNNLTIQHGSLFSAHGLEDDIQSLISTSVPLPQGASVTIEQTRALTAIDVDSGQAGEGRASRTVARAVNGTATSIIARQLRLRQIGGLIVIDFLRLPDKHDRDALTATMKAALADDPTASDVIGFTRAGLFEIKRPRSNRPLSEIIGSGGRPTVTTAARDALRAARDHLTHRPARALTITLPPAVATWIASTAIDNRMITDLFRLETGADLTLEQDTGLVPGQFTFI